MDRYTSPTVLIICGSDGDLPVMAAAARMLDDLGIGWDLRVSSAHRAAKRTMQLARSAREQGFSLIIAGAGLAAHLPGVVAACTTLPVIGVPIASGPLAGADALHAIVQMPTGVPVATVAIDGAANAAILAGRMLALADEGVAERVEAHAAALEQKVVAADERAARELATHGPDGWRRLSHTGDAADEVPGALAAAAAQAPPGETTPT